MSTAQAQLDQLRAKYNASDGVLPKNEVIETLTQKIVKQKIIKTFDFNTKLLKRYLESTPLVGGVDELINVGIGHVEDFDLNADWTKERFINEVKSEWSSKEYEDKYFYTIFYQKFATALVSVEKIGSFINEIKNGMRQRKQLIWYSRMISFLESNQYIEIPIDEIEGESYPITVGKAITKVSKNMTIPNSLYNKAGRENATPLEKQNLIMNLDFQVDLDWETARIYNQSSINGLSKMLYADFARFTKPEILATLDTTDKLYIAEKYRLNGVFGNVSLKYTNYYLHEEYQTCQLPWVDGVRFIKGKMLTPPAPETKKIIKPEA